MCFVRIFVWPLAWVLFAGCNESETRGKGGTDSVIESGEIEDISASGITAFLKKASYQAWTAEGEIHDSSGPHGKVRSFYNSILVDSLAANNTTHPKGSIAVKELYKADGETLKGYAVEIKTGMGTGADGWLWYEGFKPNYDEFYGQGLDACTKCHAQGSDYVRSSP